MKIIFEKLQTSNENIYVDFGNGAWQPFPVNDAKTNGITIPDSCNDYSKIRIKGKAQVLPNLDVITGIKQTLDPVYETLYVKPDPDSPGDFIVSMDTDKTAAFLIPYSGGYLDLPYTIRKGYDNFNQGFVRLKDNPNLLKSLDDAECKYLKLRDVELPIKEEGGDKYLETDETTYYIGGSGDEYYVDLGSYQVGVTINGSVATLNNVESLNEYSSVDVILPDQDELYYISGNIYADGIEAYIDEVLGNKTLYLKNKNSWYYSKVTNILTSVQRTK